MCFVRYIFLIRNFLGGIFRMHIIPFLIFYFTGNQTISLQIKSLCPIYIQPHTKFEINLLTVQKIETNLKQTGGPGYSNIE